MRTLLEFEKPIAELEDKLIEMRKLAIENNVDVSETVVSLTEKILELKKETFSNLTRCNVFNYPAILNVLIPLIILKKFALSLSKFMVIGL